MQRLLLQRLLCVWRTASHGGLGMQEPRLLIPLRVAFITCICATLVTSLMYLSHVRICKPSGEPCFNFEGAIQFSTFTRWSWMSGACA
jgi:hypothetical protein